MTSGLLLKRQPKFAGSRLRQYLRSPRERSVSGPRGMFRRAEDTGPGPPWAATLQLHWRWGLGDPPRRPVWTATPERIQGSIKSCSHSRTCRSEFSRAAARKWRRWPRDTPFSHQQGPMGSLNDSETIYSEETRALKTGPRTLVLRVFSGSVCPQPRPRIGRETLPCVHPSSQLLNCRLSRAWACFDPQSFPGCWTVPAPAVTCPEPRKEDPVLYWPKI